MKRITLAISLLLNLLLLASIVYILSFRNEDVNKDGEVNALDLLIVQKYILERNEK